jgi:hypothetical protein
MVWGAGGKYDTWFDQDPTVIHGINFLPITGASLYLGRHPDYAKRVFEILLETSHGQITTWRDYVLMFLAASDPERALREFETDPLFEPEFGNSRAMTEYWIRNLAALGPVTPQVSADTAFYACFGRAGRRSNAVFNPGRTTVRTHFSDGAGFSVPPAAVRARLGR